MTSEERNKATVRRLFDEVWNAGGEPRGIEDLYAPDYVADYRPYRALTHGHDGIREMVRRAHATFSNYRETLEEMVAEGDRVAVRLTISGTQTGQFGIIPPTGRPVRFEEMLILRFTPDGKVREQRGIPDNVNLLRQLGVLPTPEE